jgi:hypothetical protein
MGEQSTTPQARRAVAKLIERYFRALKRQLTGQTAGFWARVEAARNAKVRDDNSTENEDVKKPID